MKKVLFATTALVMTAGVAAAQDAAPSGITLSGDARLGMLYNGAACADATCTTTDSAVNVINRVRVYVNVAGQSDAGLSYGAKVRLDQSTDSNNSGSSTLGELWVEGSYGKITVGDVDTALENAVGDLPSRSLAGLGDHNEFWYPSAAEGGDGGILYSYAMGDTRVYASFQDQYVDETAIEKTGATWSVGAGAKAGGYDFGLGYANTDETATTSGYETWGISGGGALGGVVVKAAYITTSYDVGGDDMKQYGLGGEYKMANGVGVSAFWKKVDLGATDYSAFGLGADYDLGGGVTVAGGLGSTDQSGDDELLADFGLKFKF